MTRKWLDYDAILHKDGVSLPEELEDEFVSTILLQLDHDDPFEPLLSDGCDPRICDPLSEHHGEVGRLLRHLARLLRGIEPRAHVEMHVRLATSGCPCGQHQMVELGVIDLLHMPSDETLKLPDDCGDVETAERFLHAAMQSPGSLINDALPEPMRNSSIDAFDCGLAWTLRSRSRPRVVHSVQDVTCKNRHANNSKAVCDDVRSLGIQGGLDQDKT